MFACGGDAKRAIVCVEGSTTVMKASKGTEDIDTTGWLRRDEVKSRIGKSLSAIQRLQGAGKLNPLEVEGVYFYDPEEVASVQAEIEKERELLERGPSKGSVDAYMYDTMKSIVNLVKDPREKIDAIQFQIIGQLTKRIEELEAKLDASRVAVEAAKDSTLERNMALEMAKSESRIKEVAAGRMVETIGKLINGAPGVALTPEQLEQLVLANSDGEERFLTPEQEKKAKEIVAQHNAKKNGKQTVAAVAKTVAAGVPSDQS